MTCGAEDRTGRVCRLGKGHTVAHRFGALALTDLQVAALQDTAARETIGAQKTFAPGAALNSLARLGLVHRRYVGMRWWWFALTAAGRQALQEVAR